MSKMVKLDYEEFLKAGFNWDKIYPPQNKNFPYFKDGINKFVGCNCMELQWHKDDSPSHRLVAVPEHAFEKFKLLASPHFRTLLKAYEIKHGPIVYSYEQHHESS